MPPTTKTPARKPAGKATPFKKGVEEIKKAKSAGVFLPSIADGEAVEIVPLVSLDELISADFHEYWDVNPFISHVCIGDGCPGCAIGNDPKFKAYLPVYTRDKTVKVYGFGIGIVRDLQEIEDNVGPIRGKVIRVKRKGAGRGTKYTVINVGKEVNVDDVETIDIVEHLGPTTKDKIAELLESRGLTDEGTSSDDEGGEDESGWGDDV